VTVIPNCVPPDVLADPPVSGHTQVIVTASRLTPQKGLDILFEALVGLRSRVPELHLLVFGTPQAGYEAHAVELREQVERLGLETAVTFPGHVDRPHRHWQSASIYVQASRFEIQPVSILEAMASGLPVVATSVGGVPELVDDDVTGRLVHPDDPTGLAAALEDLLKDPDRAHAYGQAGRRKAADTFSAERMADRVLELYRRLTAGRVG
jgi:glycosyltransferase involved in cell wall biosynthesis